MARDRGGLVEPGVRRLVVAGGETSGAVVDRLGIPAFRIGAEIAARRAGAARRRRAGGEMLLALKSGNFGGPELFLRCAEADALGLPHFVSWLH